MLLDLMPIDQVIQGSAGLGDHSSEEQLCKFESYATEIFTALGFDLDIPAIKDMPRRFIRALFDTTRNFDDSPQAFKMLSTECQDGPASRQAHVMEGPIHFFGLCERHSFPFFGHAYVGYVAQNQVMGICKLTRLVRLFALQFTGQETIRQQIADALETLLHPYGIAVYLEVNHHCVPVQGIHHSISASHTVVWRGDYSQNRVLQAEFVNMCGLE